MPRAQSGTKITKQEQFLAVMIIISLIVFLFTIVFGQAQLTKINNEVESMKSDVVLHQQKNEVLAMKRNELLSYDKIDAVAKEMGLAYNNSNIKTVD